MSGREERLSAALDRGPAGELSGVALVAGESGVSFAVARGLANRELEVPNTLETRFAIGSLTKQFTAAAILRLEMEGKLSVDDPIRRHLGDFPGAKNAATVHHVLTHTSGLLRFDTSWVTTNREDFVRNTKETPIESVPGERCRYSNAGFGLLGALIEVASGESYEEFLASRFFRPLGMTHTGFFEPATWAASAENARGYQRRSAADGALGPWELVTPGSTPWTADWSARAAAGVTSTLGDLHRWELALRHDDRVLSADAKRRAFAPQARMPGRAGHYGYGWCVERSRRGEATVFHAGRHEGFQAGYVRYPERGVTVILLSNALVGEGSAEWYFAIQDALEAELFE